MSATKQKPIKRIAPQHANGSAGADPANLAGSEPQSNVGKIPTAADFAPLLKRIGRASVEDRVLAAKWLNDKSTPANDVAVLVAGDLKKIRDLLAIVQTELVRLQTSIKGASPDDAKAEAEKLERESESKDGSIAGMKEAIARARETAGEASQAAEAAKRELDTTAAGLDLQTEESIESLQRKIDKLESEAAQLRAKAAKHSAARQKHDDAATVLERAKASVASCESRYLPEIDRAEAEKESMTEQARALRKQFADICQTIDRHHQISSLVESTNRMVFDLTTPKPG